MTNTSALKKGLPPKREGGGNIIQKDPRPSEVKNKPLQVMIPPDIFEAFSLKAGQEFNFTKGAKSQLFLAMWKHYNSAKP